MSKSSNSSITQSSSCTRGFIKPTQMTDSLYVKEQFTQDIGQCVVAAINCPTGAPREAMVRITRAEPGGIGGKKAIVTFG